MHFSNYLMEHKDTTRANTLSVSDTLPSEFQPYRAVEPCFPCSQTPHVSMHECEIAVVRSFGTENYVERSQS